MRMTELTYRFAIMLAALASLSGAPVPAQSASDVKLPAFDVITVKPNNSGERPSIDFDGGSFSATDFSVKMLVLFAYDLKDDQLFGVPKWADEQRFDMKAKVLDADPTLLQHLTNDQKR